MGCNSVIFSLTSLPDRSQLLKERICSARRKFFPFRQGSKEEVTKVVSLSEKYISILIICLLLHFRCIANMATLQTFIVALLCGSISAFLVDDQGMKNTNGKL